MHAAVTVCVRSCYVCPQVTKHADELESDHAAYIESLALRADLQLGALLYKRRIRPGAMVATWSEVRGPHAGELSKADFRAFCVTLGLPSTTTTDDIDQVFDMCTRAAIGRTGPLARGTYTVPYVLPLTCSCRCPASLTFTAVDDDGGGYMDVEEAKEMIKGLLDISEKAESDGRSKLREVSPTVRAALSHALPQCCPLWPLHPPRTSHFVIVTL